MFFDRRFRRSRPETCWLCKLPENGELRERWGCDKPTPRPWTEAECWRCDEQPDEAKHLCPVCAGSRRIPIHDCPWKLIGEREAFVCQAVSHAEINVMPFHGLGWAELPATLFDAMQLVGKVKGEIERKEMERGS